MRRLFVGMLLMAGGSALAEAPRLAEEELRRFVAGKTVHLDTAIGTIPITYNEDGTLSGKVASLPLRAYLGSETDRGRWQVKGDKICQKFFRWLSGETACVAFRQDGRKISWRRDVGTSGAATIASNDATPPPQASGLGVAIERLLPPPQFDHVAASPAAPKRQEPVFAPIIMRRAAADDVAHLIEPLTRVAPKRPPVMLASASLGSGLGLGAVHRPRPTEPSPFDAPAFFSRNALVDLAYGLAIMQAGRDWCQPAQSTADTETPALFQIARSHLQTTETHLRLGCMMAEPAITETARQSLAR